MGGGAAAAPPRRRGRPHVVALRRRRDGEERRRRRGRRGGAAGGAAAVHRRPRARAAAIGCAAATSMAGAIGPAPAARTLRDVAFGGCDDVRGGPRRLGKSSTCASLRGRKMSSACALAAGRLAMRALLS